MHFPSGDDDNEILTPLEEDFPTTLDDARDLPFTGENAISGWTEPALRSDRMCWSLVTTAYALAYELGLFGNFSDGTRTTTGETQDKNDPSSESRRSDRIKRLLFIYVTQTSGRLGFPSMFPEHVHECSFFDIDMSILEGQQVQSVTDTTANVDQERPRTPQDPIETIQQCWAEITSVMKATNSKLFPSKDKTRELIRTGEYLSVLEQHQPVLRFWKNQFDSLDGNDHAGHRYRAICLLFAVEKLPKVILSMEFEYTRRRFFSAFRV